MAGVSFTLDDSQLIEGLRSLERAADNHPAALNAIGAHFVFSTQRNFELERTPDGTPWPRLSPRTAAHRIGRRVRGFDHMLRVKNRLYSSISYDVLADGVAWGTNLVYGRVHQLGGVIDMPARRSKVTFKSIRRRGAGIRNRFVRTGTKDATTKDVTIGAHKVRIPARQYLGFSSADRQAVTEIMSDHLRKEAGR